MTPEQIEQKISNIKTLTFDIPSIRTIHSLVNEFDAPEILEIGSCLGRSTVSWALSNPKAKIWTVDIIYRQGLMENTKSAGVDDRITQLVGNSAGIKWDKPVDIIFIDGAHDYRSVVLDIKKYDKFAKHIICGHDYTNQFIDVKIAVDKFYGARNKPQGGIWIVRK